MPKSFDPQKIVTEYARTLIRVNAKQIVRRPGFSRSDHRSGSFLFEFPDVFGQGAELVCRKPVGLPQKFGDRGGASLDYLREVIGHAARQGDQFVRVLAENLGHALDALRSRRVHVFLFHLGQVSWTHVHQLGEFPQAEALGQPHLAEYLAKVLLPMTHGNLHSV